MGHVLHYVENCLKHAHPPTLDHSTLHQHRRTDGGQLAIHVRERAHDQCRKLRARHAAPGVELLLTAAHIASSADARNNPLLSVAAQVKHQVAGAVRRVVRAPPEIAVLKVLKRD